VSYALPKIPLVPKLGQLVAWDGQKFEPTANVKAALVFEQLFALADTIKPASAAQAAVITTAATNSSPWGFATQAQADAIVTLLNEIRSVLVAEGLMKGSA
jgi:hypothetical protein